MAFAALKDAAKSGDRDRLEQVVDFPAVRENLKSDLSARIVKAASTDSSGNEFAAGLAALLGPAVIDRMVDAMVTPDGLAELLRRGTIKFPNHAGEAAIDDKKPLQVTSGYRTLDRFRVVLTRGDDLERSGFALTMERRGLFSWRLIRIDVPESVTPFGKTGDVTATAADDSAAPAAAYPEPDAAAISNTAASDARNAAADTPRRRRSPLRHHCAGCRGHSEYSRCGCESGR